jgi:hypothetical protein
MKKDKAIEIIKKLKPSDKYVITVSVMKDETISHTVTVNNFLTLDLPIVRNKISEEIYSFFKRSAAKDGGQEASSIPVTERSVKSMLE